jgi:hypothetical protein
MEPHVTGGYRVPQDAQITFFAPLGQPANSGKNHTIDTGNIMRIDGGTDKIRQLRDGFTGTNLNPICMSHRSRITPNKVLQTLPRESAMIIVVNLDITV